MTYGFEWAPTTELLCPPIQRDRFGYDMFQYPEWGRDMEKHRAGADGRRLFTAEFKQQAIRRITTGECTVAELSRELGVNQALLHRWKHRMEGGARVAVQADDEVVPASALKAAHQRIKELERALGRKTMAVEILEAARDEVKKKPSWYGVVNK